MYKDGHVLTSNDFAKLKQSAGQPKITVKININGGSNQDSKLTVSRQLQNLCNYDHNVGGVRYRCSCRAHTTEGCCYLCSKKMWWADGIINSKVSYVNQMKLEDSFENFVTLNENDATKKERVFAKTLIKSQKSEEKQSKVRIYEGCRCIDCDLRLRQSKRNDSVGLHIRRQFETYDAILNNEVKFVKDLTLAERRQKCREQICRCANNKTSISSWHYSWHIGTSEIGGRGKIPCCKFAFAKFYGLAPCTVDRIIKELKFGERSYASKTVDMSRSMDDPRFSELIAGMRGEARKLGFELTQDMMSNTVLANTSGSLECFNWLKRYIQLVGDPQPNRCGEIHLDGNVNYRQIHEEYLADMQVRKGVSTTQVLEYNTFRLLWQNCFPHVKIRQYKAVDTKCLYCTSLTFLRTQVKSNAEREELTRLQMWHRVTFMGERKAYYARKHDAKENPSSFLSTIGDGMQQGHNQIPWMGSSGSQLVETLDTVIQGILVHHKRVVFYRHFANVGKGPNVAIFAWLRELEKEANASPRGVLPDTIYHQIDGGGENVAKANIAIAEWLVLKGLTKKVVLTRLQVGVSHIC